MAHIVSFYSYKGGVGRSLLLANVAALLAQAGKRVACIDFDLEAGGLHTIFGVDVRDIKCTLLDLLATPGRPDIARALLDLTPRLPKCDKAGQLLLLPTVTETKKLTRAMEARRDFTMILGGIIEEIEALHRPHIILVDSRSGFAELASAPLRKAHSLVCVLRPNRQNVDGLKLLLDILSNLSRRLNTLLVLSQVPVILGVDIRVKELETLLGKNRKFHARIPYYPELGIDETVVAMTCPTSSIADAYRPVVEWLIKNTP